MVNGKDLDTSNSEAGSEYADPKQGETVCITEHDHITLDMRDHQDENKFYLSNNSSTSWNTSAGFLPPP